MSLMIVSENYSQQVCPKCERVLPLVEYLTAKGKKHTTCAECVAEVLKAEEPKGTLYPTCQEPGCSDGKHFHVPPSNW